MTATAAVWSGQGFTLERVPLPEPGDGELVVAAELATICGSDVHTVSGHRSTPVPTVLGHEAVGRVVSAGPSAAPATGDRVTWTIGTSCGTCSRCERGVPQKCCRVKKYGHEAQDDRWRLNGALASHVHLLADTGVVRVPEELPAAVAAPANCATATVTCAARRVGLDAGDAVVVIGCGMLGLTAIAYVIDRGATVIACDVDPRRRDLATALGAETACTPDGLVAAAHDYGADVVLELSGHHLAVESALQVVDLAGRVALVGSVSPGPTVPLDPNAFVRNLTTVVGSHNYAYRDLVEAVGFLARTPVRDLLASLVSEPHQLDKIDRAVADAQNGLAPRISVRP